MGKSSSWERSELAFLVLYAICFYIFIIRRSLQLSQDHYEMLHGLRPGLLADWLNDVSDAQWRNFRGNLPILTAVFGSFTLAAMSLRTLFHFKAKGMAVVWLLISFIYLLYLHGVCIIFIMAISLSNFLLVKIVGRTKGFLVALWAFNICVLLSNRVYEGYSFSSLGTGLIWTISVVLLGGTFASILIFFTSSWKELKHSIRFPTFSPRQGFILVSLRMISFGYDYHWANQDSHFDQEKHTQRCPLCKSGKKCYLLLQERALQDDKFSLSIYLCYLMYAPLYIAGPIISFNAFASQLDLPQTTYSVRGVALYGFRWAFGLLLIELMTHLFYYNAFALSGFWKQLSAVDVFIISYGVLNFMWLKFFLMWRFFRFWSLINGIEAPENMPKCINNCYNLESFWKSWHASFNKWLVRYMYIPLGGSKTKLLNVWVIFTFVALWHDLEWKLVSWAWLTCIFFIPELLLKSAASTFKVENIYGKFVYREFSAIAGSITITCLMVANLVGFVVGPSGINWLIYRFTHEEGLPVLGGLLFTFYVGTKLMFRIRDAKQSSREIRSAD